jgi:ribosomal protein S21
MEDSKVIPIKVMPEPLKFGGLRIDVRPCDNKDALKILKKKLEKDNVLRLYKERRYYDKPSVLARAEAKKQRKQRK